VEDKAGPKLPALSVPNDLGARHQKKQVARRQIAFSEAKLHPMIKPLHLVLPLEKARYHRMCRIGGKDGNVHG
jgi:hypothetical protein